MKALFYSCLIVGFLLIAYRSKAGALAPPANGKAKANNPQFTVINRNADSKIWERITYERTPTGQLIPKSHHYTEVATGMHYLKGGKWVESKEQIDILPNGTASATQGRHQVSFPGDIYVGVIDLTTPDGQRLKSRPLGLSYFDGTKSVLIAELTNSVGQLVSANQVIYPNAFTDFAADLRYTYRKGGFEQDIILRQQPPPPEAFGLNPQTARLQVLTEFFNAPEPGKNVRPANAQSGLHDTTLSFGSMKMMQGEAFSIGNSTPETPTYKSWQHLDGRTFLVEEVPNEEIQSALNQLPVPNAVSANSKNSLRKVSSQRLLPPVRIVQTSTNAIQLASADVMKQPGVVLDYNILQTTTNLTFQGDMSYYLSGTANLSGVTTIEGNTAIKYNTNNGACLNILGTVNCQTTPYRPAFFTSVNDTRVGEPFSVDASYPCTGTVSLQVQNDMSEDLLFYLNDDNENTVLSDTVPANSSATYNLSAGLGQHFWFDAYDTDWNEYWGDIYTSLENGLADFTSDGNFYYTENGDYICTPTPVTTTAISLANGGILHDIRFYDANTAIESSGNISVTNAQFVDCQRALDIENASAYAGNILMSGVGTAFYGNNFTATAEHLTFDQGTQIADGNTGSSVTLVNSLLTGVTSYGNIPVYTNAAFKLGSSSGIYQTVGNGCYYLATNSPYRGIGTNGINAGLLAQLHQRTTYPPIVYQSVNFTNPVSLSPKGLQDTNNFPDIGYHYETLDYAFGGSETHTNFAFTAGTAVAFFHPTYYAFLLDNGASFNCVGTATQPCWMVLANRVQERGGNWSFTGWGNVVFNGTDSAHRPLLKAQFAKWSTETTAAHVHDGWKDGDGLYSHCEFYSGSFSVYGMHFLGVTNCLCFRMAHYYYDYHSPVVSFDFQNCTFYGGVLVTGHVSSQSPGNWTIKDAAFDGTAFVPPDDWGGEANYTSYDYNSYNTNNLSWQAYPYPYSSPFGLLKTNGTHTIYTTNFNWQSSWFGNCYLPTNSPLIDHGDMTADQVGLYHFTSQTNQVKEANSTVNIGYHYVATDQYGNPLDTDGDGTSDYLEDSNGNGIYDAGDLGNWLISSFNGLTTTNGLTVFTPLK